MSKNKLNNILISPLNKGFTLVYFNNKYDLWYEDDIVSTIEDVKKPTKRLSNKFLKTTFPKFKDNNETKLPKKIIRLYDVIIENAPNGSDGFRIFKDLFISLIVERKKTIENLNNASDKIKNTYSYIEETSSEKPTDAILKLLQSNYQNSIDKINNGETKTIYIDCEVLKKYTAEINDNSESLYSLLERKPETIIKDFEDVLEALLNIDIKEYYIKFDYNGKETKMNDLLSDKIGTFIKSTAVVKGLYEIKPILQTAVFECRGCARHHEVKQINIGNITEPSLCSECGGRSFKLLDGESSYYNSRKALLEEPLEDLGNKTNPRNMVTILTGDGDFINRADYGDRVEITGILSNYRDSKTNEFNFYINDYNIKKIGDVDMIITEDEKKQIIELSKDEHIFEKLTNSVAPDLLIPGEVKQMTVCSLVGGGEVSKGRSEIHFILITNPGWAKTDLFDWIGSTAEKCIRTSGASSSGVGLTAAIDKDPITGQNVLKAGALVLASNGICISDEMDKYNKKDFGILNNIVEHGKEDFNKAGVHETLYSKPTFIAGANFKYEQYDKYKPMKEQIVFPPSFLSRMDGLFVFTENINDDRIADRILERYTGVERKPVENEIEHDLLKKYLHYAKHNFNPILTPDAQKLAKEYANKVNEFLESTDNGDIVEFTYPRFINSIARISGAIAKIHFRDEIITEDVEKVIKIKNYCFKLMGFDIENMTVDEETVGGETTSNKREQYQTIFNIIIEEKEKGENDEGVYIGGYGVPRQFIISEFMNLTGLSENTCNGNLSKLYKENKLSKKNYGKNTYYDIIQ